MAGVTDQCQDVAAHPLITASNGADIFNKFFVSAEDCDIDDDEVRKSNNF